MSYPKSGSIGATATLIKGSKGTLTGYDILNANAAITYMQVFDAATASAVTLGTTVPTLSIGIPASSRAARDLLDALTFIYGLVIAFTTTRTGSTANSSTVDYNLFYE